MVPSIGDSNSPGAKQRPLWLKLNWFVVLWGASVVVLGIVGYGIKLILK